MKDWFIRRAPVISASYIADKDWQKRKRRGTRRLGKKFFRMVKDAQRGLHDTGNASPSGEAIQGTSDPVVSYLRPL